MLPQRVLKFGGAALADGPAIRRAVQIVCGYEERAPLVVVSALRGVTSMLEKVALGAARGSLEADRVRIRYRGVQAQLGQPEELLDRCWRELFHLLEQIRHTGSVGAAEMDLVLSYGERMSALIVARALNDAGCRATPVDAGELGFETDSRHGRARPVEGLLEPLRAALAEIEGVPVVTGYLGRDGLGRRTTLGRNGGDLTASVLAEALEALEVVFYKDVPGIMSADPLLVPDAHPLARVTYREASELAFHGARVLHPAAIAPIVRARSQVTLCGLAQGARGTRLTAHLRRSAPVGLATRAGLSLLQVRVDRSGLRARRLRRVFEVLDELGLEPRVMTEDGQGVSIFLESCSQLHDAAAELGRWARVRPGAASLALVGHGTGRLGEVGRRAHRLLAEADIPVRLAQLDSASHSQVFVIDEPRLEQAARVLHGGLLSLSAHR